MKVVSYVLHINVLLIEIIRGALSYSRMLRINFSARIFELFQIQSVIVQHRYGVTRHIDLTLIH